MKSPSPTKGRQPLTFHLQPAEAGAPSSECIRTSGSLLNAGSPAPPHAHLLRISRGSPRVCISTKLFHGFWFGDHCLRAPPGHLPHRQLLWGGESRRQCWKCLCALPEEGRRGGGEHGLAALHPLKRQVRLAWCGDTDSRVTHASV